MDKLRTWGRRQAKDAFRRLGLTVFETRYQPFGIDLIEDIARLHPDPAAPKMVFDVGANVGEWTAAWLRRFPNSSVHCFEPFPENARRLRKRFRDRAAVHEIPLSSVEEKRIFYVYDYSVYNSFLPENDFQKPCDSFEIRTSKIDSFVKSKNVKHIDVLKIDAEGEDFEILRGAESILCRQEFVAPIFLICECTFQNASENKARLNDLVAHLGPKGFSVMSIRAGNVNPAKGLKFIDVLFMSNGERNIF